jgi:phage baseplate assembly protein W|tara:strand:+ start:527 stop:922 length:396 start_codon:yes stop_codon:yes gene_type:complete
MPIRNEVQYRDFDISFRANPITGALNILKNNDAVKRSLRSLILTDRFERPFRPFYGSTVRASLFENFDVLTESAVRDTIKRTIIEQEPRVELLDVRVLANEDRNLLNVTIIFRVKNDAQEDTLTVVLEGIR